jgi:plastocyanin
MKYKVILPVVLALLSFVLLLGCGSYSASPTTSRAPTATTSTASTSALADQAVTIANFAFSPQTLTIPKGTTAIWTNNDGTIHTVTSDNNVWDSGNLDPGKTFSYIFNQTGTFSYHCKIHSSMIAKVIVQ